jgi:alkanesulfonate monooxygenase SsuD/methylene tetrahydromethanopterin reductase-like flavin-dependent oxidoreductase (luciferase family)
MVDLISGGRLILGLGAGYAPEEFSAFGISLKERGRRLEEGAILLRRLWTEEHVTHEGRYYRVTDVTIGPRPVQQPRPPIWFAGWVETAIRRAARLGDAWLGGPSARLDELGECVRIFREAWREAARARPDPAMALMRYVYVADSLEQAYATVGDAMLQIFESTYFRWPHPVVKRPPGMLTIQGVAEDRFILGSPTQCIEQIERFRRQLGLTHLICRLSFPGVPRETSAASVERFTREVMPVVRLARPS